jgi:hypothetical protein
MPITGQPHILAVQDVDIFMVDIDGVSLQDARFVPAGDDLLIITNDGIKVLLEGYYMIERQPSLQDSFNNLITPAMIGGVMDSFRPSYMEAPLSSYKPAAETPDEEALYVFDDNDDAFADVFDIPLTLHIHAGDIAVLTPSVLPVPCADQNPEQLLYTFLAQGKIGLLTADNKVLKAGDTFTHKDLLNGDVVYYHDESHGPVDNFQLKLTDGNGMDYDDIVITVHVMTDKQSAMAHA